MTSAMRELINAGVFLFYGLSFIILGVTVMQPRRFSRLAIANHLKWLALFGITHGLAEWIISYSILAKRFLSTDSYFLIKLLELVLIGLSYSFLLSFGVTFLVSFFDKYRWLKGIPVFVFTAWLSYFVVYRIVLLGQDRFHWLVVVSVIARYFIAFPGCILTGHALWLQVRELRKMEIISFLWWFYFAIFGVNLYALAAGLIGPDAGFWPTTWLNTESFYHFFGFPVQIVRMAATVIITVGLVQSLKIFDLEYGKILDNVHRQQFISVERERVGRDLHDGVLQSIYAVGLKLEVHRHLTKDNPELYNDKNIIYAIDKLQEIILDIRYYIQNINSPHLTRDLPGILHSLAEEFQGLTGSEVELNVDGTTPALSFREASNIYHIVRETLTNISKHAKASKVVINLTYYEGRLRLSIKDNGCGFTFNESCDGLVSYTQHQGLRNIGQRMKELQGQFHINSREGQGTELVFSMSVGGVGNGPAANLDC